MSYTKGQMVKDLKSIECLQKEFIDNVSHEIKTPITSIQGFSQLLEDDSITNEERKEILINLMKTYLTTVQQKNPELDIIGIDKQPINTQSKEERQ